MKLKVIFWLSLVVFFSCNSKSKLEINSSELKELNLDVSRFDKELFNADLYNLKSLNKEWVNKYGLLYESFIYQMINSGHTHDPMIGYRLEKFLTDSTIQLINKEIDGVYKDFSDYEEKLTSAFQYYQYYFPEKPIPKIVTFYSNFYTKSFPYSDTLGIGLEMFLGRDNAITNNLPPERFTQYMKQDMDPEVLVSETMKNWIYFQHSRPDEYANSLNFGIRDDFLNSIIYHGKMMVLMEALMPDENPETRFGYSAQELEWCNQNEKTIYRNLIELKLIYSKDIRKIQAYINPGMTTSGLPDESPGEVGKWIGYQMVKQYFEENEITLQQLLNQKNDGRKILSFYTH